MIGDKALLSQFEEMVGPLVTFGDNIKGDCSIISKKTGEIALKGARKRSLFLADLNSANKDRICCFYTKAPVKKSKLWYKKLSHLNYKAINTLVKKKLVRDMPNLEFAQNDVCEACQKGKIKK
ncbi:hypothetical protein AgCh_022473 [Apium graveolens]